MNSKGRLAIGFFLLLLVLLNFRCNKSEESITPKPPVITLPQGETNTFSNEGIRICLGSETKSYEA